ncbi:MAG: hypothetical protein ACOZQL_25515 [Myxococcota bacterium]
MCAAKKPMKVKVWTADEPRELFDLYALLELDTESTSPRGRFVRLAPLARLYHRKGADEQALRALKRIGGFYQARQQLELALECALSGQLARARGFFDGLAPMLKDARKEEPTLAPQLDALEGAVKTLLGTDARALVDAAAKQLEAAGTRAVVVRAYAALGDVPRALELAKGLFQSVPVVRGAAHLPLEQFEQLARSQAGSDFEVLAAVVDGFLGLATRTLPAERRRVFARALAALQWFPGLSVSAEREQLFLAWGKVDLPGAFEALRVLREQDPAARAEPDLFAAMLDAARAKPWVLEDASADPRSCVALALVGEPARAGELATSMKGAAALEALTRTLWAAPTAWPVLGPLAAKRVVNRQEARPHAELASLAFAAGDLEKAELHRARALELAEPGDAADAAALLARGGDLDGAFAMLQRIPKAKRSRAGERLALVLAERLVVKPDARGMSALYVLLEQLPTGEPYGTGLRSYETTRVIRVLERWPRSLRDGLLAV